MNDNSIEAFLDGGDLFQWHLDYQETEEFRADEAVYKLKQTAYNTQAAKKYNKKYPTFRGLRAKARRHRQELLDQQKGVCYWCKKPIEGQCHVDHKVPLIKGGDSAIDNLCAVCPKCNWKRRAKLGRRSFITNV